MKLERQFKLTIHDLPEHGELDSKTMQLIQGGRINLDIDAKEKDAEEHGKILRGEWVFV